jgi:hypothetical protein
MMVKRLSLPSRRQMSRSCRSPGSQSPVPGGPVAVNWLILHSVLYCSTCQSRENSPVKSSVTISTGRNMVVALHLHLSKHRCDWKEGSENCWSGVSAAGSSSTEYGSCNDRARPACIKMAVEETAECDPVYFCSFILLMSRIYNRPTSSAVLHDALNGGVTFTFSNSNLPFCLNLKGLASFCPRKILNIPSHSGSSRVLPPLGATNKKKTWETE